MSAGKGIFPVGAKVVIVRVNKDDEQAGLSVGMTGTVLEDDNVPYLMLDAAISAGHTAFGRCEKGYGWAVEQSQLQIAKRGEA